MQHQKILIHKQQHDAYTQHQFFQIFCYQNQKGTSNKSEPEIF